MAAALQRAAPWQQQLNKLHLLDLPLLRTGSSKQEVERRRKKAAAATTENKPVFGS